MKKYLPGLRQNIIFNPVRKIKTIKKEVKKMKKRNLMTFHPLMVICSEAH